MPVYYEYLDVLACLSASNHEEADTLISVLLKERDVEITKFAMARARWILKDANVSPLC